MVRLAAIGMAPAAGAGRTTIGPALPEPPPARSAWSDSTVWATVSRAKVSNSPATSGPEGGDHETAPVEDIVTTAPSVGTGLPNASTARTRTRTGAPATQSVRSGSTRRLAVVAEPTVAAIPVGGRV